LNAMYRTCEFYSQMDTVPIPNGCILTFWYKKVVEFSLKPNEPIKRILFKLRNYYLKLY